MHAHLLHALVCTPATTAAQLYCCHKGKHPSAAPVHDGKPPSYVGCGGGAAAGGIRLVDDCSCPVLHRQGRCSLGSALGLSCRWSSVLLATFLAAPVASTAVQLCPARIKQLTGCAPCGVRPCNSSSASWCLFQEQCAVLVVLVVRTCGCMPDFSCVLLSQTSPWPQLHRWAPWACFCCAPAP